MSDQQPPAGQPQRPGRADSGGRDSASERTSQPFIRRVIFVVIGVAVAYVMYLLAAAYFPRWWARQIKSLAGGEMTPAVMWGLFFGLVFTLVPLLVALAARFSMFNWKAKIGVVLFAIVLAFPNWMTLAISVGNSKAVHDASRILSDNAPGFRWATLFGAIAGALCAALLAAGGFLRRHRKQQVNELRQERDELRRGDA
jgi:hypothetical protein